MWAVDFANNAESAIRALAEGDDQEGEPPYPCPDCDGAMFFHGGGKTLECPDCDQAFEADDQEDDDASE